MSSHALTPARLVLQRPDGEALVYALDQDRPVTLGRDAGNTIVLASQFVSKRHALVSWTTRGVHIEDQDSFNGITVNGLTVHAAELSSGDTIQIGDQHLVFELDGQAIVAALSPGGVPPGGRNKGRRLMLAALLTLLVVGGGLAALYVMFLAPALGQPAPASTGVREDRSLPPETTITPFDSTQAQATEQRAIAARDKPVDWLFDEGQRAYTNGQLRDAYRLLHGALLRDPQHAPSRRLLLRVMGERERRLDSLKAAAVRADEERKFDQAAHQWEAVQALTLDDEALNARARAESARLRQRAAQ